jgi:hypothetical protein
MRRLVTGIRSTDIGIDAIQTVPAAIATCNRAEAADIHGQVAGIGGANVVVVARGLCLAAAIGNGNVLALRGTQVTRVSGTRVTVITRLVGQVAALGNVVMHAL